jgi:hypothetical protein
LDDDARDAAPDDRRLVAHVWPLCERHADTLKVPRGWFFVDRRAARFGSADGHVVPGTAGGTGEAGARPEGAGGDAAPRVAGPDGGRLSSIL